LEWRAGLRRDPSDASTKPSSAPWRRPRRWLANGIARSSCEPRVAVCVAARFFPLPKARSRPWGRPASPRTRSFGDGEGGDDRVRVSESRWTRRKRNACGSNLRALPLRRHDLADRRLRQVQDFPCKLRQSRPFRWFAIKRADTFRCALEVTTESPGAPFFAPIRVTGRCSSPGDSPAVAGLDGKAGASAA
jgi:hypothetical protein